MIDNFQRYYGYAIRKHTGNVEQMVVAVRALLYHSVQECKPSCTESHIICSQYQSKKACTTDYGVEHRVCVKTLDARHQYCPKGESSWCDYQQSKVNPNVYYVDKGLPSAFLHPLWNEAISKLGHPSHLKRCKDGHTQNQNESFHSIVWLLAPKGSF